MELIQLKYFTTIAEAMSFTAAAELLHVSQPALSYQISNLERELGTRLFERKGRKIDLTADGKVFLPLAQGVLFRANEAVRILQEHIGTEVGEVQIGCLPCVAEYLMPAVLAEFHQHHPGVRVDVVESEDLELQRLIQSGSIDFAVVTLPGSPHATDISPLGTEYLRVVTSVRHRLAGRPSLGLRELSGEDFVLGQSSSALTARIMEACRLAGFEPKVTCQAGSLEAVKNHVRQGLGVSILPAISLEGLGRQALAVIGIEGGMTRDLSLIAARDRSLTHASHVLMSLVKDTVMQHMSQLPTSPSVPRYA
jgi:LysR family transcriptional activator of glutamate synthase operon